MTLGDEILTYDSIQTETVRIVGYGDDEIPAYLARPLGDGPFPGIVILHHSPGWDQASKEITRTFAVHGYLAILPNLHFRDAPPDATPVEASDAAKAAGGVPDLRCIGDVEGSAKYLRTISSYNGRVGCLGFCYGGREAYVASCKLPFDATIICYGGTMTVKGTSSKYSKLPPDATVRPFKAIDLTSGLKGPVLGLFGVEDTHPSPAEVKEVEASLIENGKTYEFYSFEGAGHAFFGVDQKSYRWDVAMEGWNRIWDFGDKYLQVGNK